MLGRYADFGIRTTRETLNVEDLQQVLAVCMEQHPTAILHLAAATNLIECEKNPEMAYGANAVGTYNVALAARACGAKLAVVSTSAVFDGKKETPYVESDSPSPQTHYGHSKYLAELAALGILPDAIIARTCWMFGGGPERDHKFVANIIKQLGNERIEIIGGKNGSPTYGKDFIEAMLSLIESGKRGVFHIGNAGAPAMVDIAREIVRITRSKAEVVEADAAVFEKQYPGAGARGNESMQSDKVTLRAWQAALKEYIEQEWHGHY